MSCMMCQGEMLSVMMPESLLTCHGNIWSIDVPFLKLGHSVHSLAVSAVSATGEWELPCNLK